jgi:hypothetical protein
MLYLLFGIIIAVVLSVLVLHYKEWLFTAIPLADSEARRVIFPTVLSMAFFFIALVVALLTIDTSINRSWWIMILVIFFGILGVIAFFYIWFLVAKYIKPNEKLEAKQPTEIIIKLELTHDQMKSIIESIKGGDKNGNSTTTK